MKVISETLSGANASN